MCIYGIELLADNARECRENLLAVLSEYLRVEGDDVWRRAAARVLDVHVQNVPGKTKRVGRFTGRRADRKKAIVTLAEGQRIEALESLTG